MKRSLNFFVLLLAILATQANAAFVDAYNVANWTRSVDGGSITTKGAPDSIKLTSSNAGFGERNQDFTIAAAASGLVIFNWSYKTADKDGPKFDPFGWLLNGVFSQLTTNNGKKNQAGIFSTTVKIGDVFGFRANSFDSQLGAATTTITNFSAPLPAAVPVPAAFWLMGVPMMALLRKKRNPIAV